MLRNGHVRFGRRPAETHQPQDWQGAAGRPHTYVSTWAGWCYVAFVIDAYARRILGWRTATTMTADRVLDAVEQAIWVREREDRADSPRWSPITTTAASTSPWRTANGSPTPVSSRRSGRSARAMTTRWRRASTGCTRPSSSAAKAPGGM